MRRNTHHKRMGHSPGHRADVKSHQLLHHHHHPPPSRNQQETTHCYHHHHYRRHHSHLYHSSGVPVYYSVVVLTMFVVTVGDLFICPTLGSEFPERECCDNLYPIPAPGPVPRENGIDPALPEYVASTPPATTEPPGFQTKTASAIMNCIQARDSCMNHTACHPILEVVPRVCGAEKVACSTVTITKCQAALRTLQAFPYFYPTCLCREPSSDPACNTFRDYLFDHPCSMVTVREKDPYPVHALPTCDYALDVCKKENKCIKLYRDFQTHCKQSDDVCLMQDGELCHDAWTRLRMSPMFGCICPKVNQKCERIFREVNYNPCVATETLAALASTTTALFSLEQHRLAGMSAHYNFSPAALFEPQTAAAAATFLENQYRVRHHAATAHNSLMMHSSRHQQHHNFHHKHYQHPLHPSRSGHGSSYYEDPGHNAIVAQHGPVGPPLPQPPLTPPRSPAPSHFSLTNNAIIPAARTESHLSVDESLSTPISYHGYPSPGSFSTSHSGSITVQVISSSHAPDHDSQLETPILGPQGGRGINKPPPFAPVATQGPPFSNKHPIRDDKARPQQPPSSSVQQPTRLIATLSSVNRNVHGRVREYNNTCYTALQNCRRNPDCNRLLEKVLNFCDPMRCRQDTCMKALQNFYREVESRWALEVAFCICRKKESRYDQCTLAQEQLHPVCAQRGDLGANLPSCNSLADSCRTQHDCRVRLQDYEQACAVDSVTRKCAGPVADCRTAMINILGTKLRFFCGCNGTDVIQLYDCLDWQRILWVNPCVVEAHLDIIKHTTTTSPASVPPRSTTTLSQGPTEPEYNIQSVPGNDVVSTPLGSPNHPAPPPRTDTPTSAYTTTHSTTITSHTHRTRHPHPGGRRNGEHYASTSGGHPDSGTDISVQAPPRVGTSHEFSTRVITTGYHEIITSEELTTLSTTTDRAKPATTTQPPKYCLVGRPKQPEQKIREGTSKRLYREEQPSCSELCVCGLGGAEAAICAVLDCLETKSCPSRIGDVWHHGAPKYIAHRGKCICYAGRFICEKPDRSTYTLANGVFLFLGYSMLDESVLKKHTKLSVRDVVAALQELISPETNHHFFYPEDEDDVSLEDLRNLNATDCQLGLYKIEGENIIVNATIAEEDFADSRTRQPSGQLFILEKKKCLPALEVLELLIEKQHPLIRHHPLLSILKVAKSEDNIPDIESSAQSKNAFFSSLVANPCSIILLVALFHSATNYLHILLLTSSTVSIALLHRQLERRRTTSPDDTMDNVVQKNESSNSHQQQQLPSVPRQPHEKNYQAAGQPTPLSSSSSSFQLLLQSGALSSSPSSSQQTVSRTTMKTAAPAAPVTITARRRTKRTKASGALSLSPQWWWLNTMPTTSKWSSSSYYSPIDADLS